MLRTKIISRLYTLYFRRRRFLKKIAIFSFLSLWQPQLWVELNSFHNFGRALPKEILFKFPQYWPTGVGDVKKIVDRGTEGQTEAGQQLITIPHLSGTSKGEVLKY